MKQLTRLITLGTLCVPLALVGCDKDDIDDPTAGGEESETGEEDGEEEGSETETGDAGPVDSDEDGLTDEEEAMYGTDPNRKDTDGDNYWDLWEINEGTDPLDYASRIYTGYWPYNPDKDDIDPGSWATANTNKDSRFPRDSFLDHHGDLVDIYDFTHFTHNTDNVEAYFIFDMSAQWCGPCHNVASWLSGDINSNNQWVEDAYPTVRDKVHGLRIWWMTFIVENNAGGAPELSDAESWFSTHTDNYVPVLVDADQNVLQAYGGGAFPFFYLLNPDMTLEYYPGPNDSSNENPYPAIGLVDEFL